MASTEENAIRDDHRRAASRLEQAEDEDEEEQLAFLGFDLGLESRVGALVVDRAFEGRIGETDIVVVLRKFRETLGEVGGKRILIVECAGLDPMKEQVHGGDPKHGAVEVEAVEHLLLNVLAVGFELIARKVPGAVAIGLDQFRRRKFFA